MVLLRFKVVSRIVDSLRFIMTSLHCLVSNYNSSYNTVDVKFYIFHFKLIQVQFWYIERMIQHGTGRNLHQQQSDTSSAKMVRIYHVFCKQDYYYSSLCWVVNATVEIISFYIIWKHIHNIKSQMQVYR